MLEPRDVDSSGTDSGQRLAIEAYRQQTGRMYVPGEVVEIPTDALVFTEYQHVNKTLEEFKKNRCKFDRETNDWLVHYVTVDMLDPELPPVYVDVLPDGVALVDGTHRVAGALITNKPTILAHLNVG